MGRATIITDLGEGEYTIKPVYEETYIEERIVYLTDVIAKAGDSITEIEAEISTLQSEYDAKYAELQAAIGNYSADPTEETLNILNTKTQELNVILTNLEIKAKELGTQKLRLAGATKEKTKL